MIVRIVSKNGAAAVIEWLDAGQPRRSIVPLRAVREAAPGVFDVENPEHGAAYGEPWAQMMHFSVTPEQVEDALHNYGIWTYADLQRNHMQALAAIQSLYAQDLGQLLKR